MEKDLFNNLKHLGQAKMILHYKNLTRYEQILFTGRSPCPPGPLR